MNMKKILSGKVRDVYEVNDKELVIVTTDRISAFDVILNSTIKNKGIDLLITNGNRIIDSLCFLVIGIETFELFYYNNYYRYDSHKRRYFFGTGIRYNYLI